MVTVTGYDLNFTSGGYRRGRMVIPKSVNWKSPASVRNAKQNSLGVRGALIFNLLPESIRTMNTQHIDTFKNHLDVFLETIPDEPTVTGLGRAAKLIAFLTSYLCFTIRQVRYLKG